jgi:DNA-binding beta-propeller fold protein YncE
MIMRRGLGWAFSLCTALVLGVPGIPNGLHAHTLAMPSSDQTVRTIAVGGHPYQVAVDTQTASAFVMVGAGSGRKVGAIPGQMVVLDMGSGAILRRIILGALPGRLALDTRTNRVFVGAGPDHSGSWRILMLDARSGAVLRTLPGVGALIDVQRNRVFSGSNVYDARNGVLLGLYAFLGPGGPGGAGALAERAGRYYAAVGTSDVVSVIDTAGPIGPRTYLTQVTVHYGITAMAVDEQTNRLFISIGCCWPYGISVLDASSGKLLGTLPVGGEANALLVDARTHRLFATSQDHEEDPPGYLYMIDLNGPLGQRAHWSQTDVGAWVGPLAVDEANGLVVVANAQEDVVVYHAHYGVAILDGKTGALLRTIGVGYYPSDLAVDSQRGHVYVTNYVHGTVSIFNIDVREPQPLGSPPATATTGTSTATAEPSETAAGGVASMTPPVSTPTPTAIVSSPTVTPTS